MTAAAEASPASSLLLLYYALSQAGKAIAAARVGGRITPGHGLGAEVASSVTDCIVKPTRNQEYQALAAALGSPTLDEPTSIGALWASLPDLIDTDMPEEKWPRALAIGSLVDTGYTMRERTNAVRAAIDLGQARWDDDPKVELGLRYLAGSEAALIPLEAWTEREQEFFRAESAVIVEWKAKGDDHEARRAYLDEIAPGRLGRRFLRPQLSNGTAPSVLMTWWALLFGLSVIARYHPAPWSEWIRVDISRVAVPLQNLLEIAVGCIPQLVHEAIFE